MNPDAKLLSLARAYFASFVTLANRPHRGSRFRSMTRGKAHKLIREVYPINAQAITAEWNQLATRINESGVQA